MLMAAPLGQIGKIERFGKKSGQSSAAELVAAVVGLLDMVVELAADSDRTVDFGEGTR